MKMAVVLGAAGWLGFGCTFASAQEGLATSGGIQGHNTIQQAPSGGRVGNGGAVADPTVGDSRPTAEERRTEKRNEAVTQICKGC